MIDRREFMNSVIWAGVLFYTRPSRLPARERGAWKLAADFPYRFKTVSVQHVHELGEWMHKLARDGKISDNTIFRGYIDKFVYEPEKMAKDARSLVILAIPQNIISVVFRLKGRSCEVLTPTGYFLDGLNPEDVKNRVKSEIVRDPTATLYPGPRLPLKTLAVRSGLAEYGRNNITYVLPDYGSTHRLVGYYVNRELPDNWRPLKMMESCRHCSICRRRCPTGAIGVETFVIDAGKCLTLFNERPEPLPSWIDPRAHNALVGCNRCQERCPANVDAYNRIERLAELTEQETECILNLSPDQTLQQSVVKKLNRFLSGPEDLGYLARNLGLTLANSRSV